MNDLEYFYGSGAVSEPAAPASPHAERAHAVLSASGTERWWNCPASVRLSEGRPNRSSKAANEGTAGHELAEKCLQSERDAYEFIGETLQVQGDSFDVTDDFAEAVQVYVDECRLCMGPGWEYWIENRFSLEVLKPPVAMFGTADFTAYNVATKTLVVKDLKFGRGIAVSAAGNKQLRYYGLGAWLALPAGYVVDTVHMFIVQPRVKSGDLVKHEEIDSVDLMDWSHELMLRARVTEDPTQTPLAGSWCKFCPASGNCPAQAKQAMETALQGFDFEDPDTVEILPPIKAPEIRLLSIAQLEHIYLNRAIIDQFLDAVEEVLKAEINAGNQEVGLVKMVASQARRRWVSDDEVIALFLKKSLGLKEDAVWKKKLLSPAQVEKAYEAKLREKGNSVKERKLLVQKSLEGMTSSESSGTSLVPVSDKRPAIGVLSGFEFLPAPEHD